MSLSMNETLLFFWEVETHKIGNCIVHGTNEKAAQSIWIMYFLHWFLVLNCAACVPFCFILKDKSEFTHESFIFVLFSYTLKWGFPVKAQ